MNLSAYMPTSDRDPAIDYLRGLLDSNIDLRVGEEIPANPDYQVIIAGRPTREMLEASTRLRWLVIPWAGLPRKTADLVRELEHISVHNIHHNAPAAAEMAVALMLAAAKSIPLADRCLRKGDWSVRYQPDSSILICRSSVLILGFGHIGRIVGRICSSMGADVVGIRRGGDGSVEEGAHVHPPQELHRLLPGADVLVIAVPLTESTRGMIGKRELELMDERAVLVNVGRGSVVEQEALYDALKGGRIGAAGIDVWYSYPTSEESRTSTMPAESPFWELDNVVMSPHRGGAFGRTELERMRMDHLARLLNTTARDGEMPNQVDLDHGY